LILGLAYVWRKGDLEWIKPNVTLPTTDTRIPRSLYEKLNLEQSNYKVKEFVIEQKATAVATVQAPASDPTSVGSPVKKPMFKPSFKKPSNDA